MRIGSFAAIVSDATQLNDFSYGLFTDLPQKTVQFTSLGAETIKSQHALALSLLGNTFFLIETTCINCGKEILREHAGDPFFHVKSGNERCEDPTGTKSENFATPRIPT
jgi:hypothetical protein